MEGVREKEVDAKEIKDEDENKKKQKTKKKKRRSPSLARFGCLRVESDNNGGVDMEVEFPGERNNPTHLVIMVNGIIGSALDWRYAAKQFLKKYPQDVVVHCSERNSSLLTLDGVDVMGDRLAEEVKDVKRRHPSVQKISFIGHSLGGLISRYAIARLYEEDVKGELSQRNKHCGTDQLEDVKAELSHCGTGQLEDVKGELAHCGTDQLEDVKGELSQTNGHCGTDQLGDTCLERKSRGRIAGLEPMNFITVATPHLGSRWHKQVPLFCGSRALEKFAAHTSWLLGKTGKHLFLTDGMKGKPPLLLRMVSDCEDLKFMSALQSFRRRVVYANASFDHIVGWSTSSLRRRNELPKIKHLPRGDKYPHVVNVETAKTDTLDEVLSEEKINGNDKINMEEEMIRSLTKAGWERVDVYFKGSRQRILAHSTIQVKYQWINSDGADVIQHMIDNFLL